MQLDQDCFDPASISRETEARNRAIIEQFTAAPDRWSLPIEEVRAARAEGRGPLPASPKSPRARTISIAGPGARIDLRVIAPERAKGAFLHLHGGGWILGAADLQDDFLARLADSCGLAMISVEYRLAPEHPYPAGPDDCEAAALWLAANGRGEFSTDRLFIGGDSAGAQLAVVTLLRLRDRHNIAPFAGASLVAGCYDLALTPSARNWGDTPLILNTRDIRMFVNRYLSDGGSTNDPDISPVHADLADLPPALFTVGTADPLLDDSMFMHARWLAAGNASDLAVYPGGPHVFTSFPGRLAERGLSRIEDFLRSLL